MIASRAAETLFIDGRFEAARSGETLAVIDPATGEPFGAISAGGAAEVDRAVRSAEAAANGGWGRLAAAERGRLLARFAARVAEHGERLAEIESHDTGKPISQARNDVAAALRYLEFYAGGADKVHGETIPYLPGYEVQVLRVPVGVTGHIIPWNYPLQMFARQLGPSLAVGNATVLKPSEDACLTSVELVKLAAESGFPPGAINLVTGAGETAGAALARHPGVDLISFTGSPEVGTLVQAGAAEHHARCILELGGKSAQLVFEDADLDAAIPVIVNAIVQHAGQSCSAGSRVLVAEPVLEQVVERLAAVFGRLRIGRPASDPDVGPVVSRAQHERVRGYVARAKRDGVAVFAETPVPRGLPAGGFFVAPVVFGPAERHELAREEVFGPVLAVLPFRGESDAVRLANDSPYGLVAGVWTENGGRQARVARALRVGQVFVNCFGAGGGIELPFGGFKRSGHGRGKGFAALLEFSTLQTITKKFA